MGVLTRLMSGGLFGGSKGRKKSSKSGGSSDSSGGSGGGDSYSYDGPEGIPSYHRGGKVRKTGLARLKKGERVITAKQSKRMKGRGRKKSR